MIKVSDTARDKVIQLMTDDGFNAKTDFVRVGVKSGGCSGLSYDLNFDNKQSLIFLKLRMVSLLVLNYLKVNIFL